MAIHLTPNLGLKKQDHHDPDWHIGVNDTFDILDKLHCICPGEPKDIYDSLEDIKDVFVYDTSKDINKTWKNDSSKSWHSEASSTDRGTQKDFPDVAIIIADIHKIIIYDAGTLEMWMVIKPVDTTNNVFWETATQLRSCSMSNGRLVVASWFSVANKNTGALIIDFVADKLGRYSKAGSGGWSTKNISQRHDVGKTLDGSLPHMDGNLVRDVFIKNDVILVGHNEGLSIIEPTKITKMTCSYADNHTCDFVYIDDKDHIYYSFGKINETGWLRIQHSIPPSDLVFSKFYEKGASDEFYYPDKTKGDLHIRTSLQSFKVTKDAVCNERGVILLNRIPVTPELGMQASIAATYNTGWQVGNIKRCWLCNSKNIDRSIYKKHLALNGSLTLTPVSNGSELQCVSGFSSSNYLTEAASADLDFGTGGFSVCAWFKISSGATSNEYILARGDSTPNKITLSVFATGEVGIFVGTKNIKTTILFNDDKWHHTVISRSSGNLKLYIDGTFLSSISSAEDVTTTSPLVVGASDTSGKQPFKNGSLSLLKVSATASSDIQIKKMYEDEKLLFQSGAKCLLSDESVDLDIEGKFLEVATKKGFDVFNNLLKVNSRGNNALVSISNNAGVTVTAEDKRVIVYGKTVLIRDELQRLSERVKALETAVPGATHYGSMQFPITPIPETIADGTEEDLHGMSDSVSHGISVDANLGKFEVSENGVYRVHSNISFSHNNTSTHFGYLHLVLFKNGVELRDSNSIINRNSIGETVVFNEITSLVKGDKLTFKVKPVGIALTKAIVLDCYFDIQAV